MSRAPLAPRDLAILAAAHRGGLIQRAAPLRLEALDGKRFPILRTLQLREAGYLRGPRPGERGQRLTPRGLRALGQAVAAGLA